jgi:hypothetical protein
VNRVLKRLTASSTIVAARYRAFTALAANGLPSRRVLIAFPALLVLLGTVLIGLGINGSSSGAFYPQLHSGKDPALIAGSPQAIRSDEWNVGTVWTISQIEQGFPGRNETYPGGMDAAIPYDLPRLDWSVAFRPHSLGYLFLDVGRGTAWRWWLPGLALIAAAFFFLIAVIPRRPGVAAVISIGFFFSPFFQWWYQTSTLWPIVWGLATMAALAWSVQATSLRSRLIWAAVIAYLTVVMAMGIYAPFIIPIVIVVALFGVGLVIERLRSGDNWLRLLGRIAPTLIAGAVASAITSAWLASKSATVNELLATVYPGQRLTPTGSSGFISAARTVGSSFSESLETANGFLGINSSEASTFFLIGAFLVPVAGLVVYRRVRARAKLPWVIICLSVAIALFMAFTLIPGWDALAHLLFLDRSTGERMRIGVGLASFAIFGYLIRLLDDETKPAGAIFSAATAAVFLLSQIATAAAVVIVIGPGKLWGAAPFWWLFALVSATAIFLFARRRAVLGTIAFLLVTVASSISVNPVYVGVLDLRETPASKSIVQLNDEKSGSWVGVGDLLVTATLLESGVEAYDGTQGAPSRQMWANVDPSDKYEAAWNRIGRIHWTPAAGEPQVSNPFADDILITFDACSAFAQKHVDYVLANLPLDPTCLVRESSYSTTGAPLTIYRVVKN